MSTDFEIREGTLVYYCGQSSHVRVPDGVIEIDEMAFCCKKVESVVLPDSVRQIKRGAFFCCSKLKSINIPSGLKYLSRTAFWGCCELTEISLPADLPYTPDSFEADCRVTGGLPADVVLYDHTVCDVSGSVTRLVLPEGITCIGANAFYSDEKLESVVFPDSLRAIGKCAFMYCEELKQVFLPDGVTEVGEFAFEGCSRLEKISIPAGCELGRGAVPKYYEIIRRE